MLPQRRNPNLWRRRVSLPGARYFITCCTRERRAGLTRPSVAKALQEHLSSIEVSDAEVFCVTVMPDHVHVLFRLGVRLKLGQLVGRLKVQTRDALRPWNLGWQDDYFEHRLGPDEESEPYARYLFLNPYRAGLIPQNEDWPWWWTGNFVSFGFLKAVEEDRACIRIWMKEPQPWSTSA